MPEKNTFVILMADDDEDDSFMVREALDEIMPNCVLNVVRDGEELFSYLHRDGPYKDVDAPTPGLILLDLNMPRVSGRDVLNRMMNDKQFRNIPLVVFSTSEGESDIEYAYDHGAASYIAKPSSYAELVKVMKTLTEYWSATVQPPSAAKQEQR